MMNYYRNDHKYQNKQFIIDTLIKLADSCPVKKTYPNYINTGGSNYDISQQELNIWINYIYSVFNIISGYIDPTELSLIETQIQNITSQNELTFAMRALNIEHELLNLGQRILRYY